MALSGKTEDMALSGKIEDMALSGKIEDVALQSEKNDSMNQSKNRFQKAFEDFAQEFLDQDLEPFISWWIWKKDIDQLLVNVNSGVAKEQVDKIFVKNEWGDARLAQNEMIANKDMTYDLQSSVKPILAFMVLQLHEQGKLDLFGPLKDYMPDMFGWDEKDGTWLGDDIDNASGLNYGEWIFDPETMEKPRRPKRDARVIDAVCHTTGAGCYWGYKPVNSRSNLAGDLISEEKRDVNLKKPCWFRSCDPGETYIYSYYIGVCQLINRVGGVDWMYKEFFEPLEMFSTYFAPCENADDERFKENPADFNKDVSHCKENPDLDLLNKLNKGAGQLEKSPQRIHSSSSESVQTLLMVDFWTYSNVHKWDSNGNEVHPDTVQIVQPATLNEVQNLFEKYKEMFAGSYTMDCYDGDDIILVEIDPEGVGKWHVEDSKESNRYLFPDMYSWGEFKFTFLEGEKPVIKENLAYYNKSDKSKNLGDSRVLVTVAQNTPYIEESIWEVDLSRSVNSESIYLIERKYGFRRKLTKVVEEGLETKENSTKEPALTITTKIEEARWVTSIDNNTMNRQTGRYYNRQDLPEFRNWKCSRSSPNDIMNFLKMLANGGTHKSSTKESHQLFSESSVNFFLTYTHVHFGGTEFMGMGGRKSFDLVENRYEDFARDFGKITKEKVGNFYGAGNNGTYWEMNLETGNFFLNVKDKDRFPSNGELNDRCESCIQEALALKEGLE